MRVRALVSFTAVVNRQTISVQARQEFEMPDGADWVQAGLVVALAPAAPAVVEGGPVVEAAEAPPVGETAVTLPPGKRSRGTTREGQ